LALEEIFYDTETDLSAFAAVKSGLFGKHLTLAALAEANGGSDRTLAAWRNH
jgi:hypothetical protein